MATKSVPMTPLAPALFSITKGCPKTLDSGSITVRAAMSVPLPAAPATMTLTGLAGHAAWANAQAWYSSAGAVMAVAIRIFFNMLVSSKWL